MSFKKVDWTKIDPLIKQALEDDPTAKPSAIAAYVQAEGHDVNRTTIWRRLPFLRPSGEGDDLDDLSDDEVEEIAREIVGEEQEDRRLRTDKREARALRKFLADRADLVDAFRQEMQDYPVLAVAPPAPDDRPHRPRSLVLAITDAHVGQLFHRTRGGGLGEYDLTVFTERVSRLASKVLAITRDLRAGGPVDHIVVFFGGDLLDGRLIHPGHDHESLGIGAQMRVGPEVFARLLMAELAKAFPSVEVFGVPGNHGRLGRRSELDMVSDSLDLVFMDIMELHCKDMPNIIWHPRETWFSFWTLHGHTFFGSHGDSFKSWAGVPFYGATRFKGRLEAMIHRTIDTIITGHHHSPAGWMNGFSNIIMNGSMVGTSTFGSWLGMGGAPVQKLILVSDEYAAATVYDLILADRSECLTLEPVQAGPRRQGVAA